MIVGINHDDLIDLVFGIVQHTHDCVVASIGVHETVAGINWYYTRKRARSFGFFVCFAELGAQDLMVKPDGS